MERERWLYNGIQRPRLISARLMDENKRATTCQANNRVMPRPSPWAKMAAQTRGGAGRVSVVLFSVVLGPAHRVRAKWPNIGPSTTGVITEKVDSPLVVKDLSLPSRSRPRGHRLTSTPNNSLCCNQEVTLPSSISSHIVIRHPLTPTPPTPSAAYGY